MNKQRVLEQNITTFRDGDVIMVTQSNGRSLPMPMVTFVRYVAKAIDFSAMLTAMGGKADINHTHVVAHITDFTSAVNSAVSAAITALINGAPNTLDTLKEIADKLASDESVVNALISAVAGKADAAHTHTIAQVTGLQDTLNTIPKVHSNTVAVAGGAGNAVFYLTNNGLVDGTPLFTTVKSVLPMVNDSALNYTYGWSLSGATLTVNVKRSTGINVALLGLTLLGVPANVPNGMNVSVLVHGT